MASATGYTPAPEIDPQIDHIIDIPKEIPPTLHDLCCIYKVPIGLHQLKEEAYKPQLISIGPFHHKKPELEPMQKEKQRYFLSFWNHVTNKKGMVKYKTFLHENIEMIRHSYSEPNNLTSEEFLDMILLDSVFILELFLRKSNESNYKEKDYMFTTSWICKGIQRDLLLLENQLPIFVLEELYKKIYKDNSLNFLTLACNYFEDYYYPSNTMMMIKDYKSCKNFTDLIRSFYLPREIHLKEWIPSSHFTQLDECVLKNATQLNEAGVSFEKVQHRKLLEIKFKKTPVLSWFLCLGCLPCSKWVKARLQIPQLKVNQTTECVLRNLIALEQCHYSEQPFICNYVSLIDSLINTQEDVELLVDKEVIVHKLGCHQELATMMNGLCKNIVVTCNYYGEISKELNDHYYNYWKHYMGMLRSVYFRDPWRFSSTFVGVIIFIFALANFLRLVGLYHPKY